MSRLRTLIRWWRPASRQAELQAHESLLCEVAEAKLQRLESGWETADFAERLADAARVSGALPPDTAYHLLMAVSTFAKRGGDKP